MRDDLIRDEGIRLKPYKCTAGKTTIGIGRNLDDVGISQVEAEYLLDNDIAKVKRQLSDALPWVANRNLNIERALSNMCFQLGIGGLLKFKKMLACLEEGDYAGARKEALDSEWARQTPERAKRVVELFSH